MSAASAQVSTGILYWCAMEEMGTNMPATLNPTGGPTPRAVFGAFSTGNRYNGACHVAAVDDDLQPRTFSNGTTYPNAAANGGTVTPYSIAPTGCLVRTLFAAQPHPAAA
eukprot:174061-Chlamydomonas_euryale.AAC.1